MMTTINIGSNIDNDEFVLVLMMMMMVTDRDHKW